MEADNRSSILAARKPASPQAAQVAAKDAEKLERIAPEDYTSPRRIAPRGDSSFTSSFTNNQSDNLATSKPSTVKATKWADDHLKKEANRMERCILAVRDAARCAEKKKLNPACDAIYVTPTIRKGWNLNPDQLSKGLKLLEKRDMIRFVNQRRGKHARFVLKSIHADSLGVVQ